MTVNVLLNLNIAPEDATGNVVYALLARDGADELIRSAAAAVHLFFHLQADELAKHKERMDREGIADPAVAASLDRILQVTREMQEPAAELIGFAQALVRCGSLKAEAVQ